MMRTMQLQHAKQVTKMREEMQLTAQQMAERQRLHMHEFKEQQEEQYRQHTQAIEDRKSTHIQVCTPFSAFYMSLFVRAHGLTT